MISIKEHVSNLFKDIEDSDTKKEIMQDIIQNLNEKVTDLTAEGKSLEDAINKAIVDFGDIDDIKKELSRGTQSVKRNTYGIALGFSIWGSIMIIALCIFMNFYYSPNVIWFIYPTFAVLWWPLSLTFIWLKNRKEN